jgi:hypothetical protein
MSCAYTLSVSVVSNDMDSVAAIPTRSRVFAKDVIDRIEPIAWQHVF